MNRIAARAMPTRSAASTQSAARAVIIAARFPLLRVERRQNVVGEVVPGVLAADPDAQTREPLADGVDDRAQTVVGAGATALAQAQLAERQLDVVDDDEALRREQLRAAAERTSASPESVHVGRGLDAAAARWPPERRRDRELVRRAPRRRPASGAPARRRRGNPTLWRVAAYSARGCRARRRRRSSMGRGYSPRLPPRWPCRADDLGLGALLGAAPRLPQLPPPRPWRRGPRSSRPSCAGSSSSLTPSGSARSPATWSADARGRRCRRGPTAGSPPPRTRRAASGRPSRGSRRP